MIRIDESTFVYNKETQCDLSATLDTVVPAETIDLTASLAYHCLPSNLRDYYNGYTSNLNTVIKIKPLTFELYPEGSTDQVLTGDTLEYVINITMPEVTTTLDVNYEIPTISSNARGKRSLRYGIMTRKLPQKPNSPPFTSRIILPLSLDFPFNFKRLDCFLLYRKTAVGF